MVRRNGGFIGTDGLDAPDPPTGISASAGDAQVSVAFTAPTDTGTSAITGFVAQVSTNDTAYSAGSGTGTSSPITVSSLTNGTAYTAKVWAINAYGTSSPSDASGSVSPLAAIGVYAGGQASSRVNVIQSINIAVTSNTSDFGDLLYTQSECGACSSSTRGVIGGGYADSGIGYSNVIQYITLASSGNAQDFGDLTVARGSQFGGSVGSCSSSTRGIWAGGFNGSSKQNVIDYVTIASTGNATDFGNLTQARTLPSGLASPTRGVFIGSDVSNYRTMDYITIASTGNATDFGDILRNRFPTGSCSNSTRGLNAGGEDGGNVTTTDYITIASTGNATDFGDLTQARRGPSGVTSSTRAVYAGGDGSKTKIDYFTIASTGNATNFGNLTTGVSNNSDNGMSTAHGGLA